MTRLCRLTSSPAVWQGRSGNITKAGCYWKDQAVSSKILRFSRARGSFWLRQPSKTEDVALLHPVAGCVYHDRLWGSKLRSICNSSENFVLFFWYRQCHRPVYQIIWGTVILSRTVNYVRQLIINMYVLHTPSLLVFSFKLTSLICMLEVLMHLVARPKIASTIVHRIASFRQLCKTLIQLHGSEKVHEFDATYSWSGHCLPHRLPRPPSHILQAQILSWAQK